MSNVAMRRFIMTSEWMAIFAIIGSIVLLLILSFSDTMAKTVTTHFF